NVGFSSGLERRQVPGSGWGTWNSPPNAETSTPAVLWTQGITTLTLTLDHAVAKFGIEIEPNPQSPCSFTANFSIGDRVTRAIYGNAGSLLFAAGGAVPITTVTITGPVDFAIAQIRYSLAAAAAVPEPSSLAAWGLIVVVTGGMIRSRRRVIAA